MKWLGNLHEAFEPRVRDPLLASVNESDLTQIRQGALSFISWDKLMWIVAYKKDCWSLDDIRVIFSDGEVQIECSEDAQSFSELSGVLMNRLVLKVPDWYERLMSSPAFEANPLIVYGKDVNGRTPMSPTR